jgi:tetratricopeptide (TPR) repeat protein
MKLSIITLTLLLVALPCLAQLPDTEPLMASYNSLKEAVESKKAPEEIKKLAMDVNAKAEEVIAAPAPDSEGDKEILAKQVDYAKGLQSYSEYALFSTAAEAAPAVAVDLFATLEQDNPKSKYLDEGYARYFYALNQAGQAAKVPAIAEKALANFPNNGDLLLVLADSALSKNQADSALRYASRLVSVMNGAEKPEGVPDADWQKKKSSALGRGYWIVGLVQGQKQNFFEADKNLRAALPYIRGNDSMAGPALYMLGVANYQLGRAALNKKRVLEAADYSDQAAKIKGAHQQAAWNNAQAMRTEAAKMR